jgi:hypothetical protein
MQRHFGTYIMKAFSHSLGQERTHALHKVWRTPRQMLEVPSIGSRSKQDVIVFAIIRPLRMSLPF